VTGRWRHRSVCGCRGGRREQQFGQLALAGPICVGQVTNGHTEGGTPSDGEHAAIVGFDLKATGKRPHPDRARHTQGPLELATGPSDRPARTQTRPPVPIRVPFFCLGSHLRTLSRNSAKSTHHYL
jgi:hypothetical protein